MSLLLETFLGEVLCNVWLLNNKFIFRLVIVPHLLVAIVLRNIISCSLGVRKRVVDGEWRGNAELTTSSLHSKCPAQDALQRIGSAPVVGWCGRAGDLDGGEGGQLARGGEGRGGGGGGHRGGRGQLMEGGEQERGARG